MSTGPSKPGKRKGPDAVSDMRAARAGSVHRPLLEQLADLLGLPREVVPSHSATDPLPLFLTADEAAVVLRISQRSVNQSCAKGELLGTKVSGQWRVSHLAVLAAAYGIDLADYLPSPRVCTPAPIGA